MTTTVQKWGNSQAVRLPKVILETSGIKASEQVRIFATDNQIIIEKINELKEHISLAQRLKDWDGKPYELTDEDKEWLNMPPAGKEIW